MQTITRQVPRYDAKPNVKRQNCLPFWSTAAILILTLNIKRFAFTGDKDVLIICFFLCSLFVSFSKRKLAAGVRVFENCSIRAVVGPGLLF